MIEDLLEGRLPRGIFPHEESVLLRFEDREQLRQATVLWLGRRVQQQTVLARVLGRAFDEVDRTVGRGRGRGGGCRTIAPECFCCQRRITGRNE